MFDIKWIRENPQVFDQAMAARGASQSADALLKLDDARKEHIVALQQAQEDRNRASKEIGKAKASGDEAAAQAAITEVAKLKDFLQSGEEQSKAHTDALRTALSELPNIPLDDVPAGTDESNNVVYKTEGEKPAFTYKAQEHYELGENLGQMSFETATKLSGSRFVVLRGSLARMERALGQFMLDLHTDQHGYEEVNPPLLVRDEALFGTGQLPKFAEDLFRTTDGKWLIPTAEVPLSNLVREEVLPAATLPLRFTALTPCFRSEAGSAGRDTRGMLRQHQFAKTELVSITRPEDSPAELERMLGCAEAVLKALGLHYRVMTLCVGDMGFSARKTYDIEVWLPGQDAYREISSCSLCGDFQARRMNTRMRKDGEKQLEYCHTLNGSGIAVGRALIAVMENYQNEDGSITVPEALRPYMGDVEQISTS